MDITLADLLQLEPRLSQGFDSTVVLRGQAALDVEVSWAVSARATAPLLPALRGGELLLIPARVTAEIGDDWRALIGQAQVRGVSAVVFASSDRSLEMTRAEIDSVQLLYWDGELGPEAESSINRVLTECRGSMFRVGTELERKLNELGARQTGVEDLARSVSRTTGIAVSVRDSKGREVANTAPLDETNDVAASRGDRFLSRDLAFGARLLLGPLTATEFVLARFLAERIVIAADLALSHDDLLRPRGAGKAQAFQSLLETSERLPSQRRAAALALGLDPDDTYLVAVTPQCQESGMNRTIAFVGTAHEAGEVDGDRYWLIVVSAASGHEHMATRTQQMKRAWIRECTDESLRLALSAPTVGVAGLPAAAQEARFIAALQRSGRLQRNAAAFDSLDDLGALRVLYQLRQSPELRLFVEQVLGSLVGRETLSATLKVFLESGGSQVEASKRLGIHRNTLTYRLRRVASLIGVDVTDPDAWLTLHLAISAADLFQLTSSEP